MKTRAMLLTLALPAVAMAQEHNVQIQAQKGQSLRTKIESSSESTSSMTMLINGEEAPNRGGGEATTTSKQTIEFDETVLATNDKGQATKVQRTYTKLSGTMTIPGRDGEQEIEIEGALEGKPIHLAQDGDKVVATEKDEDGAALEERLARGLRVRTDLTGLTPGKAVAVGSEFDLSKTLRDAVANLQHPMARAQTEDAGGGNQGGGRGGRGGRGGGAFGGGRGMTGNEGFGYLMNEKLELEATGKLESVEDGKATISFKATSKGDGNPTELGVGQMGGRFGGGGRGGRGGEQGGEAPPIEGTASIECTAEGKLVVDIATKRVVSIDVEGEFEMQAETKMTREGRDGQPMDIETSMDRNGTFNVKGTVSEAKSD